MRLTSRERSPLSEALQKGKRLVSERSGIIRYLYEFPCDSDAPQIFAYGAITTDSTGYGFKTSGVVSGSTSIIRERAIAGALGEAVERYSAAVVPYDELLLAPYARVAGSAIDPRSLVLYSDRQYDTPNFPYRRFDDQHLIRWVEGYSLTREKTVLVPAFAVYIPYKREEREHSYVQQITTGLACGNTIEEAILSGLCEVAERDATMMMWLGRRTPPRIQLEAGSGALAWKTFERFGPARKNVILLDASSDTGIPAIVAIAFGRDGFAPASVFASKASLQPGHAATGALDELAQCIIWVRGLLRTAAGSCSPDLQRIDSIEDHVLWPAFRDNQHCHEFCWSSREARSLMELADCSSNDVKQDINTCVALLAKAGLEVIVVDVTAPDIRDVGFHVVRVIVPEAQPLSFGANLYRTSKRLRASIRNSELNTDILDSEPCPHPFP